MNSILQQLENKRWLWQGAGYDTNQQVESSGYAELDNKLAGGFPVQGVVEIKTSFGIGELRCLLPFLREQQNDRTLVFIAPPGVLNGELLQQQGINLQQILVISAVDEKQALWCAEQCLRSGCCSSVLLWQQKLEVAQVRRLMLASERGGATTFLLRQQQQATQFSLPVSLSMRFAPAMTGIKATIEKRRGGRAEPEFLVDMQQHWPQLVVKNKAANVIDLHEIRTQHHSRTG